MINATFDWKKKEQKEYCLNTRANVEDIGCWCALFFNDSCLCGEDHSTPDGLPVGIEGLPFDEDFTSLAHEHTPPQEARYCHF